MNYATVSTYLVLDTSSSTMLRWAFTRKGMGNNQVQAGKEAGSTKEPRYNMVTIESERLLTHRAVWMLKHKRDIPDGMVIDHIDGNTKNNHPDNLQLLSYRANTRKGKACTNAVGFSWYAKKQCWRVRIRIPGRNSQLDLGSFKSMLDARAAYLRKCKEIADGIYI